MPDRIFTSSGSRRWVVKRDWPGRRLSSQGWMSAAVSGMPRRTAVDHAAERGPVALAEGGDAEQMAERVVGHGITLKRGVVARVSPRVKLRCANRGFARLRHLAACRKRSQFSSTSGCAQSST